MNTWTAAKQQISKYGVTDLVNAGDLTIEHGALDTQMLGNPFREIREAAKHLSISGDQLSLAGVDMEQCTEAVNLQLEDVIVRIEWFGPA